MVERLGGSIITLGISRDSEEDIRSHLDQAIELGADMIISSAGVSVGEYDFVRSVISQRGMIDFWRINIRPGKPFAFGNYGKIPFFGLPGNPVSSFVTFLIFVVPAIKLMCGFKDPFEKPLTATLSAPLESDGRESYLRSVASRSASGEIHVQTHRFPPGFGKFVRFGGFKCFTDCPFWSKIAAIRSTGENHSYWQFGR